MTLPSIITGVPRNEVASCVKLMLLEPEIAAIEVRIEPDGRFTIYPIGNLSADELGKLFDDGGP